MHTWILIIITVINGQHQWIYQGSYTQKVCEQTSKEIRQSHKYTYPYTAYACKDQTTDNRVKE